MMDTIDATTQMACPTCIDESEGIPDEKCRTCSGTGVIYKVEHPDWCDRCGVEFICAGCDV